LVQLGHGSLAEKKELIMNNLSRFRMLLLLLLALPAVVQAQFNYTTSNGTITITGYTGPGGAVVIPATIDGLPVTRIEYYAFSGKTSLTSVTIPNDVTNIGSAAFESCTNLTSITIPGSVTIIGLGAFYSCTSLTNVTVPNSVTRILSFAFAHCTSLTSVMLPNSVTSFGSYAFLSCTSLTSVRIPIHVSRVGEATFNSCTNLTAVFFQDNAPEFGADVFLDASNVTVYYLPGTTGWGTTFADRPAVLWNPRAQTGNASFGVRTNRFGFTITGTADIPIVVEACTNLANASWVALQSLNLTNGAFYFSDPNWTNYPARTYRIRSP
jgi:hypothetical protein